MENNERYMKRAIELACENTEKAGGKPFGAVIVKNGEIIAEGVNEVLASHDPTAHAEMQAIRLASRLLGRGDLSDCELYASGDPCPMCLAAIYWAGFNEVYHCYTEEEAAQIGMSTKRVYDELSLPRESREVRLIPLRPASDRSPYELWKERDS